MAKKQLLSEIERDEQHARERASKYETLVNEAERLKRSTEAITRLMDTSALPILERMRADLAQLPDGLLTKGTRFIAGGFDFKDLVGQFLTGVILDLEAKRTTREKMLAVNAKKLVEVEHALSTKFPEGAPVLQLEDPS